MALIGGNIYCNLEKNTNGSGTEDSPYSPSQLSAVLGAATGLSSSVNVLLDGTKILSAGSVLDLSTPLMTTGNVSFTLTFKKKSSVAKCPSVYCDDGLHTSPFLVKLGGGSFKTFFADVLVQVRGNLNATLESLVHVVGSNQVFLANNGLVANDLMNFSLADGGCCCCCGGGSGLFLPVSSVNQNVSLYENTLVIHANSPEVLAVPEMEKLLAMANNMVILGNVGYTFLFPTNTSTKAERNFFFKVASTPVSVVDNYETSVLTPEGVPDVGDFTQVHPLGNVVGTRFTLNLKYGANVVGNGKDSIPTPSAFDDNYPSFSTFSNKDAGYACSTDTEGDVITTIGGREVLVISNLVDADNPKKTYTLFIEANGDLVLGQSGNHMNSDTHIGSDSDLN
jgi:hypothetical protein